MVDIVLTLHYAYEGLHEAWSREPEPIREEAISTGKAADDLVIEWATARERFVAAAYDALRNPLPTRGRRPATG